MRGATKKVLLVLLAASQILLLTYVTTLHKKAVAFFHPASSASSSSSTSSSSLIDLANSAPDKTRQLSSSFIDKRAEPAQPGGGSGGGGGGSGDVKPDGAGDVKPASGVGDVKLNSSVGDGQSEAQKPLSLSELPSCPEMPPNLEGYKPMPKDVLRPMDELEKDWGSTLKPGGHYHPPHCRPRDRTAIIIPCRNRWEHLRILLNHLIPFLIRQEVDFSLFVVESDQDSHFNKGILLNAGYLESLKLGNYSCFVFQDVDLLPLNDYNLYRCGPQPRHLAIAIDKFKFNMPYHWFFGGTLALSGEQYEKVNGHSNVYFGWGGEDDDIAHRVQAKGYKVVRVPMKQGQYHMIRHARDKGNEEMQQKMPLVAPNEAVRRMDVEGVHQVIYTKDWVQIMPLYTWIHLTVDEKAVIQNLPDFVRTRFFKNGITVR